MRTLGWWLCGVVEKVARGENVLVSDKLTVTHSSVRIVMLLTRDFASKRS